MSGLWPSNGPTRKLTHYRPSPDVGKSSVEGLIKRLEAKEDINK
jgi:hypothetical protein